MLEAVDASDAASDVFEEPLSAALGRVKCVGGEPGSISWCSACGVELADLGLEESDDDCPRNKDDEEGAERRRPEDW